MNLERAFNLHSNELSGAVPSELGGLIKLTSGFNLHFNKLVNAIPTELG